MSEFNWPGRHGVDHDSIRRESTGAAEGSYLTGDKSYKVFAKDSYYATTAVGEHLNK